MRSPKVCMYVNKRSLTNKPLVTPIFRGTNKGYSEEAERQEENLERVVFPKLKETRFSGHLFQILTTGQVK